jgi:hypothetical protein
MAQVIAVSVQKLAKRGAVIFFEAAQGEGYGWQFTLP